MAKAQGAVKGAASGGAGGGGIEWPSLNPTQFQGQYDMWLRENEKAKPFGKMRELNARIAEGDKKIGAALKAGKVTPEDDTYKAAMAKLEGLRAERAELIRTAQVPHFALATLHNFLRASRGWGLREGSKIRIQIPGSIDITVDLSEVEPPF